MVWMTLEWQIPWMAGVERRRGQWSSRHMEVRDWNRLYAIPGTQFLLCLAIDLHRSSSGNMTNRIQNYRCKRVLCRCLLFCAYFSILLRITISQEFEASLMFCNKTLKMHCQFFSLWEKVLSTDYCCLMQSLSFALGNLHWRASTESLYQRAEVSMSSYLPPVAVNVSSCLTSTGISISFFVGHA